MPKISDEKKEARREQILAGARRCFGRYGYEGATVARLEQETGLSRGAIFNYFGSKEDIFIELAARDRVRLSGIVVERGFADAMRALAAEEPEWLGTYMEIARRLRTDPDFRKRYVERASDESSRLHEAMRERQQAGELRQDLPLEALAEFLGIFADGLSLHVAAGAPPKHLETLISLVEEAHGARRRTPARRSRAS